MTLALVTGAAGDIGAATARRLAVDGARVIAADRDATGVKEVASALRADGLDVAGVACDQTDPDAVQALFDGLDGLDVCFANAGVGRYSSVLEQSLRDWQRHVDVNLTGTFLVCQAAARAMVVGGRGGAIVINGSTAALRSTVLFGAYAASKAGVEMLARCMADELGPYGIRVNTVCPGVIETGMTGGLLDDAQMRALIERETPAGRVGRPEDVADAVAFLAGDGARYVTGTALLVDGGQTLRGFPRWFAADGGRWRPITEVPA